MYIHLYNLMHTTRDDTAQRRKEWEDPVQELGNHLAFGRASLGA